MANPHRRDALGILSILVLMPLLFSAVIGPALGKFDPLDSTREWPVYIAVRPMTDGGFVMAKLVMALVASVLTWLLTLAELVSVWRSWERYLLQRLHWSPRMGNGAYISPSLCSLARFRRRLRLG